MEQLMSEYLFLVYVIPIISIIWANNGIKSFISFMQFGSVLFLLYGAYQAFEVVDGTNRYLSDEDKIEMFFVTLSPFFLLFSGVFLSLVCLNSVLEHAMEYSRSKNSY